ncbi:MAG: DUF6515 family protein [Flavobacteriaceae bacterium]
MMKSIKILLIVVALIGTSLTMQAHEVKVYPRNGTIVAKVYKPRIVVHKGINFYYAKGIWYKPYGRKYVVCRAPIGLRIRFVPKGYKIVRVNGKKYYHSNGIYYVKKRGYYTVVRFS